MQPERYAPDSVYHQRRRWTHPHTIRCLDRAMYLLGTPGSLLDVGCAEGVLVRWARERQIDAWGVDLAAPDDYRWCVRADLREPVELRRRFDWVLCWEVAEHLPASAAGTLCDTLARHLGPAGRLLFTAAPPGQDGPGHIHLADAGFWDRQLQARGLAYAARESVALRELWAHCSPKTPWYGRNARVYWWQA